MRILVCLPTGLFSVCQRVSCKDLNRIEVGWLEASHQPIFLLVSCNSDCWRIDQQFKRRVSKPSRVCHFVLKLVNRELLSNMCGSWLFYGRKTVSAGPPSVTADDEFFASILATVNRLRFIPSFFCSCHNPSPCSSFAFTSHRVTYLLIGSMPLLFFSSSRHWVNKKIKMGRNLAFVFVLLALSINYSQVSSESSSALKVSKKDAFQIYF